MIPHALVAKKLAMKLASANFTIPKFLIIFVLEGISRVFHKAEMLVNLGMWEEA